MLAFSARPGRTPNTRLKFCVKALIGETAGGGDVRHGYARAQRRQRLHDAQLIAPCMQREARFAHEKPRGVERGQPDRLREFGERQRREQIAGEALLHRFDARRIRGDDRARRVFQREPRKQRREGIDESGLGGERIDMRFQHTMRDQQTPREIGIADDFGLNPLR